MDVEERIQREEFRQQLQLELAGEFEAQLLQLEEHFLTQKQLAEKFGIDTTRLTSRFEEEKTRIQAAQLKKQKDQEEKATQERLARTKKSADAIATVFSSIGDAIGGAIALAGEESGKFTALSKTLAIAQIAIKTAEAIANAVSAGSSLPFPGNIAAIIAGVGTVLGNIASAKKILSSANVPSVPQRKKGGYIKVQGQDDGLLYRARYIGQPTSGMLPDQPVLMDTIGGPVLASEAGAEYFVNHQALKNPKVLNHVRAIDNIVRVKQFQEGGPTAPLPQEAPTEQTTIPPELMGVMIEVRDLLADLRENGVEAFIADETAVALQKRLNELAEAGGQ